MTSPLHSVSRQSNFLSDSDRLVDLDLADDLLATIPESIAREMLVLPIGRVGDTVHVVMTNTDDIAKQDKLRFLINFNIKVYRRSSHELREAIEHHYGRISYEDEDLEDYKLRCQMERASRRRQEQTNEIEHELEMKRKQAEARRSNAAAEAASRREIERLQSDLKLQIEAARQTQQREHLEGLKAMGVELTEYLTQGRANRVIELRSGDSHPHVHLDQNS